MVGGSSKSVPPKRSSIPPPKSVRPSRSSDSRDREPPTKRAYDLVSLAFDEDEDGLSRTSQTAIKISPAKGNENAMLTVLTGLSAGQVFMLMKVETVIGRGRDCSVKLDDQGISRRHCRVVGTVEGGYVAE
ncbi:MAG: FHA domain-containing protein, partial [Polyangiaceae bacterium]